MGTWQEKSTCMFTSGRGRLLATLFMAKFSLFVTIKVGKTIRKQRLMLSEPTSFMPSIKLALATKTFYGKQRPNQNGSATANLF